MRNITVDDRAASGLTLTPSACNGTGWQVENDRGLEGSGYRWCASSEGPKASFTFTGVAIYYSCPSFSGDSMQFALDGGILETVNLTSAVTPELRPNSSIVWWKTGLDNKQHTLEISPGPNSTRVYVDAFVYTTLEDENTPSTSAVRPIPSMVSAQQVPESEANRAPIAVFSIVAFIVFAIFLAIAYNLWRMSKERSARYWNAPLPPLHQSKEFGASTGMMMQMDTDSIQLKAGESSLGHTQSVFQSPQASYAPRTLPTPPGHHRKESEDEISSMQFYQQESAFVAATDLRKPRRGNSTRAAYPPPQSPVRTDTSFSTTPSRLEPNRRPRA